jgi:peptidoglycan/LPS O-acetylase OafA/YrhL
LNSKQYRPDVDGLRAVAVIGVVTFHAFPIWVPGGFVGVDIFFVISGFLITSIITKELEDKTFSFPTFYARRARRIFPALVVVLATLLGVGWFLLLADEYAAVGKHTAAGAGFIANIAFFQEAGYFDASAKFKPLLHLWSLGIEEQFYLVWPALLFVVAPSRGWRWIAGALAAASLAYCFWLTPRNAYAAFFLPLARFWELMVGALLAYSLFGRHVALLLNKAVLREAASICGAALVAIALIVTREGKLFPAPMAIFAVLGTALLIAAGPNATVNRFVLGNRAAVFVGLISYPLYLWHWPLLSVPHIIEGDYPTRIIRISAVVAAFLLAVMTYWAVERPLRGGGLLREKAIGLAVALVGVGFAGFTIYFFGGAPHRVETSLSPEAREQIVGPLWRHTVDDDCKTRFPLADVENYGYWFCKISSPRPPTIMIVGSSYANHYYPGFAQHPDLAEETVLSIGACDPAWIDESDVRPSSDVFSPCTSARRLAQQVLINGIAAQGTLKLVVLAGFGDTTSPDYIDRVRRRVDFFEQSGARVALFGPHVKLDLPISVCFPRPLQKKHEGCNIPPERIDDVRQSFRPLVETLRRSNPNVIVFDPNGIFCGETCSFVRDDMPLFRDQYNHFTEHSSELLANRFLVLLRELRSR